MSFDPKVYRNSKDGIGSPGDPRATDATDNWTAVSLLKGLYYSFNVTGITVTFAAGNLGAGTATNALRTVTASNSPDVVSLASMDTKLSTLNFNTDTLETALGILTETAPATDTASSGLNGRLQRIAQNQHAGAANIAKAEDVASADADVGVPAMAVRKATPANTSGTDGDYEMIQMSGGRLWIECSSTTAPVSTMNSASANAGVNAALAGVFDDSSPTAITENSFGFLRMSAARVLYGTLRDAAGNERGANVTSANELMVKQTPAGTGTQSSVVGAAADTTILASNANRKGASIYNDSTAILYLLLASATSSTTAYSVQIPASGYFELPACLGGPYTGVIKGIWASATGNARVTEFT